MERPHQTSRGTFKEARLSQKRPNNQRRRGVDGGTAAGVGAMAAGVPVGAMLARSGSRPQLGTRVGRCRGGELRLAVDDELRS